MMMTWPLAIAVVANSCRSTPAGDEVDTPAEISPPAENGGVARRGTERTVSFEVDIKPILGENCVNCHNRELMPERVSFESKRLAMTPMGGTPVIVPGSPGSSRMIVAVTQPDTADRAMPPVGHRIDAGQVELLRRWIKEGAYWPEDYRGEIQPAEIPRE